jgi:hypothetical protein
MRKINSYTYKKSNARRSRKQLKKRIKFKLHVKKRNKSYLNLSKGELKLKKKHSKFGNYYDILAPEIFSFRDNTEEVVKFINDLKFCFDESRRVFIKLRKVKAIDYDAIVILLSILVKFKSKNIPFNGNLPKLFEPRKKLVDSGFFESLYKEFDEIDRYKIKKENSFITHANKKVDANLGLKLIESISKELWGEKRIYKGFQRTFVELMQNSFCHADPLKKGEKHWWMSVNLNKVEKSVSFAFIDYGVGICGSLDKKQFSNKFFGWAQRLRQIYQFRDRGEALKLILEGKLHETVTGNYFRGKGLPGICETVGRNQISNLCIITNNVFADVSKDNFKVLNDDFSGTFIYFELNELNAYNTWEI